MPRGVKPAPTGLKILKGTRPDRINRAEPPAPSGRPEPPEHLNGPARAEFARVADELAALGILSTVDRAVIAVYAVCYVRWLQARQQVAERGILLATDGGGSKANPAVAAAEHAEALMLRALAELGLTPSSRSRLASGTAAPADDLGAFLGRRPGPGR